MKNSVITDIDTAGKLLDQLSELMVKIQEDLTAPIGTIKTTKVAIVVGHSVRDGGAVNPSTGMQEYEFNKLVANDIAERLNNDESHDIEGIVVLRDEGLSGAIRAINATGAVLCLSLHCNAYNSSARGCETLYYHKSINGRLFAAEVQENLLEVLSTIDRGIKPKASEDRGGYMLSQTNMPCVIAEPFFIDEDQDYKMGIKVRNNGSLAQAYVRALVKMADKLS